MYDKYTIEKNNLGKKINDGLYVAEVEPNSNAELAGIKIGDVITHMDNNEIESVNNFRKNIFEKSAGDTIKLKIIRGHQNIEISMNLE